MYPLKKYLFNNSWTKYLKLKRDNSLDEKLRQPDIL